MVNPNRPFALVVVVTSVRPSGVETITVADGTAAPELSATAPVKPAVTTCAAWEPPMIASGMLKQTAAAKITISAFKLKGLRFRDGFNIAANLLSIVDGRAIAMAEDHVCSGVFNARAISRR